VTAPAPARPGLPGAVVPIALVVIAMILRVPDLATRGTWDADQGHDMLALRALVRDGVVPLLGPPTSIGDVHHGALYYYLLSPAAFLTGGDSPLAVAALIALAGIAAVLVTWWLARSIGGPLAGLVAGLAMAVSTSAVDESTFIWNPNLIALSSSIALAGAWYAWTSRRRRWWLVAAVGTAVTMQCHVLGITLLPVVGALLVADARRRPPGSERRAIWWSGLAGLAIIAISFLPLVVHELTNDFSEVHAALDYLRGGGEPGSLGPLLGFLVIAARVASWPLTGLLTDAGWVALVAVAVVIAVTIWSSRSGTVRERQAARWLGLGLLWTAVALTFLSPSLATIVPDLPNDHYHAFADPMVFTLLGLGAAALWRVRETPDGSLTGPSWRRRTAVPVGPLIAIVGVVALLAWNLAHQPPGVHPDGGFPAADLAAARILAVAGDDEITLWSLPDFKSAEAYGYPLVRAGGRVRSAIGGDPVVNGGGTLVVICDSRFEVVIGAPCGGPAEATIAPPVRFGQPIDRFVAAPGRTISIYRAGALARRPALQTMSALRSISTGRQ
jgi:4-amino-4-deoxy-L-arabinose transferase-like glycosyltransferase